MLKLSSFIKNQQNSTTIRATGMEITIIDKVSSSKCKCTSLCLSFNQISDLANLNQFSLLETLHLESNNIERISELEPLSHLPLLKALYLSGNKVCNLPLFKAHIIHFCPKLQILDGRNISSFFTGKYTREKFNTFLIQEKKCLKSIYINDIVVQILKYKKKKHIVAQDFFYSLIQSHNFQDKTHDLRLQCKDFSPSSYFKFLRQKMIDLNQLIYKNAIHLKLEKNLISQYSTILQSFENISHFNNFLNKSEKLNEIALSLINHKEDEFDENTFNELHLSIQNTSNHRRKVVHRNKNLMSYSSDSISSQFCNSDDYNKKTQTQNKNGVLKPAQPKKNDLLIPSDDNDSASLSNDSSIQINYDKKSFDKLNDTQINAQKNENQIKNICKHSSQKQINLKNNLISTNNYNTFSSDFEFSSDPLKTSSSSDNISKKEDSKSIKTKNKRQQIHEEETLPSNFQNHNEETMKSNLFLTELASEEILSKSQQSFTEENPNLNAIPPINEIKSDTLKNTSTEIDAEEINLERKLSKEEKNNNDSHIHFNINQSVSPELASDEINQNTQSNVSDSNVKYSIHIRNLEDPNKIIHFPTSQVELASDEANQDTDSAKIIQSLSIEVASSSSSNKDDNFDQLSEGNEMNPSFNADDKTKIRSVQISNSLELASDETLPHSSNRASNTNESDLQNGSSKRKNLNDDANDHSNHHHLKLPHSASLEFASDETLSNTHKSSSAFEDFESEDERPNKNSNKNKRNQIKIKIISKNAHEENIISQDSPALNGHSKRVIEEDELASEEGQNEEHVVLFDPKLKKHLKASQESFSLDEMASGETLPSANPLSSDEYVESNFKFNKYNNQMKIDNISEDSDKNDIEIENEADFEDKSQSVPDHDFTNSTQKLSKVNKITKDKTLPSVAALSTYFKIWKMNYSFRVKRREMIKTRIMSKYNLSGKNNHIKEMKKKQQLMNSIERQKEINKSKYELFKQLNYEYQRISQSSE